MKKYKVEIFNLTFPKAEITPIYTSETEAMKMLMDEKIFLAITSRSFTKNELNILLSKGYKSARSVPIAYDGLAIIVNNANVEPVFLSFPTNEPLEAIIDQVKVTEPEYDFVSEDGIGHTLWCITDDATIAKITEEFDKIPYLYIADGHHRTAAAAHIGEEKAQADPKLTPTTPARRNTTICWQFASPSLT